MLWELIRSNRRKSWILLFVMAASLLGLGYVVGMAVDPAEGGFWGVAAASALFTVLAFVSYFQGDSIMLGVSRSVPITPDIHPQLFNVVEEMKIASGLPVMPKVYLIPDAGMNAFATGMRLENCSVSVTAGLLESLNRDELQGVVAHEMSHIQNRDVLYMTLAGVMLGTFQLLSEMFLRGWFRSQTSSTYSRSRSRSSESGQFQILLIVIAIVFAILGPILIQIFYFSLSRRREYLADACGVRLTRYPEGLASALEKISFKSKVENSSKVTAALFIETPNPDSLGLSNLSSTHPPVQDRIRILRQMSGVDYVNYQKAFSEIRGRRETIIPSSGLKETSQISIVHPDPDKAPANTEKAPPLSPALKTHAMMDLMRAGNSFSFLICPCGLKVKIPPDFKNPNVKCPRCSRRLEIPMAISTMVDLKLAGKSIKTDPEKDGLLFYERKSKGWESFQCSCAMKLQLSPAFMGSQMECSRCGRQIQIKNAIAV